MWENIRTANRDLTAVIDPRFGGSSASNGSTEINLSQQLTCHK